MVSPAALALDPEGPDARLRKTETTLVERDQQLRWLERRYEQQERRIRALEKVLAATDGGFAQRAMFVLTAPSSRLAAAVRARRMPPS